MASKKRYIPESELNKELTPKQFIKLGKLKSSPKTSETLFNLPKGWQSLNEPADLIQKRRVLDRKRTLARAEAIIRRTK